MKRKVIEKLWKSFLSICFFLLILDNVFSTGCSSEAPSVEAVKPMNTDEEDVDESVLAGCEYLDDTSVLFSNYSWSLEENKLLMPSTVTYPFYNHDYEKSIKLASENLKKRSLEHPNPSQPIEVTGMTIRHDYLLLAVSYELSGQVERAYGVYSMLYGWLPEMTWASLRLGYAIEQGKCPRPVDSCYDIAIPAYRQVCEFVPTLPLPSIDAVVRRVNLELDDCKSKRRAVPCDFIDWEAIHLYRLRDNCARIVCPDLHYREAPSHTNNDDRVLCIRTRIAYSKFMKYMEEHYAKHMTTEGDRDVAEQATKTMEILRKIAELPY